MVFRLSRYHTVRLLGSVLVNNQRSSTVCKEGSGNIN